LGILKDAPKSFSSGNLRARKSFSVNMSVMG